MKKEYIEPQTKVTKMFIESSFCLGFSDQEGGEQLGKDFDDDDYEDGDNWE